MHDELTLDKNSAKIFLIYQYFDAKPGAVLHSGNFLAIGRTRRWDVLELQSELDFAVTRGWVEKTGKGLRLTNDGYKVMVNQKNG